MRPRGEGALRVIALSGAAPQPLAPSLSRSSFVLANKGDAQPFITVVDAASKSTTVELHDGAALEYAVVAMSR